MAIRFSEVEVMAMKKIITMALCLMLVLSITACGTNKSETSTNDKSAEDVTDYANIKSDE